MTTTWNLSRRASARRAPSVFLLLGLLLSPVPGDSPSAGPSTARVAIVGDYGSGSKGEVEVADLVSSWHPDAVVTVGDNNYPRGAGETIDAHVGRYYHDFVGGYRGSYGEGAAVNRFFPALGNHDWMTGGAEPYLDYFDLPGNERYYDVGLGPVRIFVIDSDPHEPDGNSATSKQAAWLRGRLSATRETWKLVVFHHPPYSSGMHGPSLWMRWPFKEWGATAVITGHDHDYERIFKHQFPYFVNGIGGAHLRAFRKTRERGSRACFASDHGAMRVVATAERITFEAIDSKGNAIDAYELAVVDGTRE